VTEVLVIGGGVAGLGAALALGQDGHRVRILERDDTPFPGSPVEAFTSWQRPGAPQVWHSHAFLARLRNLLRDRAPGLLRALAEAGAEELHLTQNLPPTVHDRRPMPGDEDLVLLACRRITFEWVLRKYVLEELGAEWHGGVKVVGLEAERDGSGLPRVRGVLADRSGARERLAADLVVDASGARSHDTAWLAAIGVDDLDTEETDSEIFYSTRFYRLRPGASPPDQSGIVGADLGYMKYAVFPGDSGIFSVTLAAPTDDEPFRAVLRPAPFAAAAEALPAIRPWLEPDRSEPMTEVRGMGNLRNRIHRFVAEGRPRLLDFHAIGDAAICSNPLYGRGCTLAFVHAELLADALREHGRDAESRAVALDAATRREIEPWYRAAVTQDREASEIARQHRAPSSAPAVAGQGNVVDPKEFMRSVFRDGLLPAMRSDAVVLRAFARGFNLLESPEALMQNADVVQRVLAAWRERDTRAPVDPLGPPRDEMLEVIRRAA
jgi:2-polyprenyl-6-methoxyphenol hydroxylase-like FAD-dependent oxidoreductase